ncbi:unnamed protein product [Closterium sp. NIES-54]
MQRRVAATSPRSHQHATCFSLTPDPLPPFTLSPNIHTLSPLPPSVPLLLSLRHSHPPALLRRRAPSSPLGCRLSHFSPIFPANPPSHRYPPLSTHPPSPSPPSSHQFLCCSLCATAVHQLCYGAVGLPPLWAARSLLPPSLHAPLPPLLPLASEGKVEGEGLGRESDQSRHGGGGGGGGAAAAAGQGVYAGEGGGMQLSKQAAARRFKWRCVPCHLHARACSSGGTASSTCSQPPPLT